ncbi:MAG: transporter substrate-binding domain-containing protein [Bacteroidota bacterium]|jgi:glutamine transport system substrate-binding protein
MKLILKAYKIVLKIMTNKTSSKMKKNINKVVIALTLTSLISLVGCNQNQRSTDEGVKEESKDAPQKIFDKINSTGQITVGFEPDAPPLYFEESGTKKGFDYDLITYLSKEVFDGVSINTTEDGYDQLPKDLKEGKIDLMAGGRTDEENSDELYSDPYLSFGYCLITTTGLAKKYRELSNLNNTKIGVYDDFAAQWVKSKLPTSNITIIGDREDENTPTSDWMLSLIKGEFDVIIYDYPFAANEILDYDKKITITNNNLNGDELSEYVLVLNKRIDGAAELMDKINEGIKKFKESSKYSDAVVQYIPVSNSQASAQFSSANTYTIKRGETLSIIARDHLGDVFKWKEIYQLNKNTLASPDIIYPGQNIIKPSGWN